MNQHVSLITQHNWYRIDIDIFWLTNRLESFFANFQPASCSWSMIQLQSIEVKPLIHIPRNEDEKCFLVRVGRNDWLWREAIRRIRSLFLSFFFLLWRERWGQKERRRGDVLLFILSFPILHPIFIHPFELFFFLALESNCSTNCSSLSLSLSLVLLRSDMSKNSAPHYSFFLKDIKNRVVYWRWHDGGARGVHLLTSSVSSPPSGGRIYSESWIKEREREDGSQKDKKTKEERESRREGGSERTIPVHNCPLHHRHPFSTCYLNLLSPNLSPHSLSSPSSLFHIYLPFFSWRIGRLWTKSSE